MGIDIVHGAIKNPEASMELVSAIKGIQAEYNGTLFLAYPLMATADSIVTIDALLITKEKGLIAFIFDDGINSEEKQNQLFFQITNTLNSYESLRRGRSLAITPTVISFFSIDNIRDSYEDYIFTNKYKLSSEIASIEGFDSSYYEKLIEALQKISTLKPKKKRNNIRKKTSRGSKIKFIEQQIANLDQWQKKAAYEIPDGPQRIRGLAGSGKTVVLALKAAYLHAQYPDWEIAVTYYTRSLYQQFRIMISNFVKEFLGDEPEWSKLHILHAWGTFYEKGIYSVAAELGGFVPVTYENAKNKYGTNGAFSGICHEAINLISNKECSKYDVILIDEAQDLPSDFFKLCFKLLKQPKRIVFAYDELQNLRNNSMPTLEEMFGKDSKGNDLVKLENREDEARQDIVLPICYRNTPWALSLAHSLGFGIYNKDGIFQLFSDLTLWDDIGYGVIDGELEKGKHVKLKRKAEATPSYFKEKLDIEDAVIVRKFDTCEEQYKWVADEIGKNINEDELDPDDILVIFPNTYYSKSDYTVFRKYLLANSINSHLAGVGTTRDIFKVSGDITCAHIYRAKGNEAPMVYVLNSDFCFSNTELRKVRNILFTAITRSRAWVRICGVGDDMEALSKEAYKCINNDYCLEFNILTDDQLKEINLIHRDKTEKEVENIKKATKLLQNLISMIQNGEVNTAEVPEFSSYLSKLNNSSMDDWDNEENE